MSLYAPQEQQQTGQHSFPAPTDRPVQVLVVEDDQQMARMIAAALAPIYRVTIAADGQEGLEQALALHPDLVLCDISMPRMSGKQLVAALRGHPDFVDVPIVVLSGRTDEQLRIELLRAGAQDYLLKPCHFEELRARVANQLTMRQVRQLLQREVEAGHRDLVALASDVVGHQHALSRALAALQESEARLQTQARELEIINGELRGQRDALTVLNADLEEAKRARSQFLSTMSHELRTPLTSVIGFSQMLLDDAEKGNCTGRQKTNLERILKNGKHLLVLINDVLDLTKIEAGRMDVNYAQVNLQELISSVVEEVQSIAIEQKLTLNYSVEEGLGVLETDPRKLRQVLINLLSNALKFTVQGEVMVTATCATSPDSEGGVRVAIAVKDTGIGIAPEHQERIFEAFFQVDSGNTRKFGGTGLGLAIVRQLTTFLGGTLEVISSLGQGSTFTVFLPTRAASVASM